MTSSLHAIAELLALRFVDSLVEGTGICLLAALVLGAAPRQNAATRFLVWFSALAAIAGLPWINGAWPHPSLSAVATRHAVITLPDSWALYFLAFWSVLALWFSFGVVRALWHLNVLRRNCVPVGTAELDPILRETLERHGSNRSIVLCTSDQVRVPTALGLFKPTILIPTWVIGELSTAELNQILLHELAHLRRWDDWTNLFQQIVKATFFFHPAVWWIDNKVAVEREMACDDAVVAETRSPRAYAECLAHLAEKSFVQRGLALAQAALGRVRQTSARVAQLLDANRPTHSRRSWIGTASFITVLAVCCGALYSRTPRLVAFGSSSNPLPSEVANLAGRSTAESPYFPKLPVVHAKLSVPGTRARLTRKTGAPRMPNPERLLAARRTSPKRQETSLVHLTQSTPAIVPLTQTIWVVVESDVANPAAPQGYQIQWWRVTVLRTVINTPNRQTSRSEI